MKPIYTFLCAVLLTIASQASGQNMSSSITTVTQPPYPLGSPVVVHLNVSNFTNVSSVLLPITYNSTVLRFDSMSNPAIPDYTDLTPMFHPNPGVIKITWFPNLLIYPDGVSIAGANARLITIHFTVMANGNSPINVSTTVPFTPIEVVNAMGNVIFSNNIFNSSGSGSSGVSVTGGVAPPPVGFKIMGTDVYAKQGNRVCVPVTVNDFDNIQDMQFAMHWDVTKLTYECVRGTAAPIVPSFNPPALAPGTLLLLWEDPNLLSGMGVTKPDFTRIYEVCFNTIGAPGTQSSITFDGFGFGFPPDFTIGSADAHNSMSQSVWTGANHPNGPSGVSSTVYIMAEPPGGVPVTYTMDKDTVAPNMQSCVDIKVKNFSQITESEFLLTYDATKLSLITPFTIPVTTLGILPSNIINSVTGTTGTIKFKWAKAAGATVSDNTTIFSMCFTAIGAPGDVPLAFGTSGCPSPTPYSTHKKDAGGQPYRFNNGAVTIKSSGPPPPMVTNASCFNTATGAIDLDPNGTATSYLWSNSATTQDLNNVMAGTYTVTVTYAGNTTATVSAIVGQPAAAISMTQTVTGVNCQGQSNGSINMTPAGGTSPYTYAWVGPNSYSANTQDIMNVPTGNYVVTITDNKQCTFTSAAVNVPSPQALAVPNNNVTVLTPSCFGGTNASINITPTGGTTPYTYDWSNDGPEDPDNDPQNIVGLGAGIYTVTITDSKGCTFAPSYTITSPAALTTAFVKKEDAKCFGSASGKIEITAAMGGSGNKTYCWKAVGGGPCVSVLQNPIGLAAGMYNVTVTDGNGCTATLPTGPVTIDNPTAAITFTNTTTPGLCFGQPTGSITTTTNGGWGNYTYQWPSGLAGLPSHNGVSSGTYIPTVTDQAGCTATQTVVVGGAQSAISIGDPVISNVSCFGTGNGGICITPVGGNGGPYAVSWSSGTLAGACIGTLPPGTYAPIVTDGQMCTEVFSGIVVDGPSSPVTLDTNITVANPLGGIELIVAGGTPNYTFAWTGGITTQNMQNVPAGTYTVTVTDANNCTTTGVYTIPTGNVLTGNVTVASIQHSCGENGCINLNIAAAANSGSPFTLTWNNGGSLPASPNMTPGICGLQVGLYTVTVTASNGNTTTVTAVVNQLQPASYSSNFNPPQGSLQNGSITITPSFSNANYTYLWGNGATTAMLSSLDSGLYMVTITNGSSGCTAVPPPFHLKRQYPQLVVEIASATNPTCATSSNGSIKLNVSGGVPTLSYKWTGPNGFTAITKDILNVGPGSYAYTITQGDGTIYTSSAIDLAAQSNLAISNVNELSITPGGTQVSGANLCDGVAQVVFSGASGNVNIIWSNGVTTAINSSLCGGAYGVTVTDAVGCSNNWSDALTVPAAILVTNTTVTPKCFGEKNGSARVKITGGIEPYEVVWSNGQFDQVVFSSSFSQAISLASGTYTVTVTDKNFVPYTTTVTVPAAPQIEVTFTGIDPNSFNACDGERIAFVTGAADPVVYTWAGSYGHNGDTKRAEGLCAGEVLYFDITDANGCSASVIDTVPYPPDGCFQVRPVLTPAEQDGNNDFTLITCIEAAKSHTVEIYNRWGQLVFQTSSYNNNLGDPTNTWTGYTRSGQSLPEGVYFYVVTFIDEEDNQHQIKGTINLLK